MNAQELEARFKEIDRRERSALEQVTASVAGYEESTGKLSVSASSRATRGAQAKTETLLDVKLHEVDIPDAYVNSKVDAAFSNQRVGGLPGVKVMQHGAGSIYEVVEDYTYRADGGYSITALKGFEYDRASIPRIFWVIIDKDDLSNVPPLFHDLLYRHAGSLPESQVSPHRNFQREEADNLFLELMKKTGVKSWRARLAYEAVSNFAGGAWKKRA
ncbi:MAG: DUF1353 domain-containing protein [Pyrinomonadaceae bacterium]